MAWAPGIPGSLRGAGGGGPGSQAMTGSLCVPLLEQGEGRVVYVRNLSSDMSSHELKRRFEVFGEIVECQVLTRSKRWVESSSGGAGGCGRAEVPIQGWPHRRCPRRSVEQIGGNPQPGPGEGPVRIVQPSNSRGHVLRVC